MLNLKDDSWMMSPFPKDQLTVIFENAYFVKKCRGCKNEFTAIIRKHHCRGCGKVFCGQCTRKKLLNKDKEPLRLCQCCEIKRINNNGVTPSNDKENIPFSGNSLRLSFDLEEEDDTTAKLCGNAVCDTPLVTPAKPITEEIVESNEGPIASGNVTFRTPMSKKHLDMIQLAFTPPQSPNSSNAKSDKRGVLNFCCIFLAVFCIGWLSTQLTGSTSGFISDSAYLLEHKIPLETAFLQGKTDLQSMIDMQVQLVESHLAAPTVNRVDVAEAADNPESVHSVSVTVVKRKERFSSFKHQLALWGGFGTVIRKIWQQIRRVLGKVGGLFNYFGRRRKPTAAATATTTTTTNAR